MRDAGITWSTDAICLHSSSPPADSRDPPQVSVRALRDLTPGEELCCIPKTACITPDSCSIHDIIAAEGLGGGLALVVAVMHEVTLGHASKWVGYFASMPRREYLPGLFWSSSEIAELQGTEIESKMEGEREDVEEDFQLLVAPLAKKYPDRLHVENWNLDSFRAAASLVASRAFGIDPVLGDGMVPLADAFNHKVSVVKLAPGYAVHGMSDSDEDNLGDGEVEASTEEEKSEAEEDLPLGLDFVIPGSNGTTSNGGALPSVYGIDNVNGLHLALEIGIVDGGDCLRIVAANHVTAGAQVHNTYGELSNAELVCKYGFALAGNPFTSIEVDKKEIRDACWSCLSKQGNPPEGMSNVQPLRKKQKTSTSIPSRVNERIYRSHVRLLMKETDLLEDGEEPFELLANGHISSSLFVVLRVLCWEGPALEALEDALLVTKSSDGSILTPESIGAVCVWPISGGHAVDEQYTASPTWHMVTSKMCEALEGPVRLRLGKYPTDYEETARLVKAINDSNEERSDAGIARRAALTLRLSEQELLVALLGALERRKAHALA